MNNAKNQLWLPTIKKSLLILISTFVIYLIFVGCIDLPLTEWVNQHNNTFCNHFSKIISNVFNPTLIIALVFIFFVISTIGLLAKKFHSTTLNYLNSCALIIILTDILVSFFKIAFGRARPFLFIKDHIVGFYPFMNTYDYFSSPSGHVFITMALVLVVFGLTKKLWIRAIALLFLVSVVCARIILLNHFLADCIFSIGLTLACFEYRTIIYNKIFGWMTRGRVQINHE